MKKYKAIVLILTLAVATPYSYLLSDGVDWLRGHLENFGETISIISKHTLMLELNFFFKTVWSKEHCNLLNDIIKKAIELDKLDADQIDIENGDTILHKAVKMQNTDLINLLIELGTTVDKKNNQGETPMVVANKQHNRPIFDLLVDALVKQKELEKLQKEAIADIASKTAQHIPYEITDIIYSQVRK